MHDQHLSALLSALRRVYRGNPQAVELLVCAWLARGHVLIEDIPGVGKTTLARAFAAATGGSFKRVQCTPDLMPADITGVSVWDERERKFVFHPGPVFAEALADFGDAYADQNELDFKALQDAQKSGRVEVVSGI